MGLWAIVVPETAIEGHACRAGWPDTVGRVSCCRMHGFQGARSRDIFLPSCLAEKWVVRLVIASVAPLLYCTSLPTAVVYTQYPHLAHGLLNRGD